MFVSISQAITSGRPTPRESLMRPFERATCALFLLVFLAGPTAVLGQLFPGVSVRVTLRDTLAPRIEGIVVSVGGDTISVGQRSTAAPMALLREQIAYIESRAPRPRGLGFFTGAGRGFIVGAASGAIIGLVWGGGGEYSRGEAMGIYGVSFGILGLPIGAVSGLISPGEHWDQITPWPPTPAAGRVSNWGHYVSGGDTTFVMPGGV